MAWLMADYSQPFLPLARSGASGFSPVTQRLRHRKRVWQMPHLAHFALGQKHFHNVETDFYPRVFQQPQIIQRRPRQPPTPFRIDRGRRPRPLLRRAGFHLDEGKTIVRRGKSNQSPRGRSGNWRPETSIPGAAKMSGPRARPVRRAADAPAFPCPPTAPSAFL